MNVYLIGLFIISSVACSTSPEPIAVHDFGLSPIANPAHLATDDIKINVTAPEWLTDTRIRYRLNYADKTQIRYYAKDRWIAPPVQLFEQYLLFNQQATWLGSRDKAKYRLRIYLSDFEQQFDSPDQAHVLLSLLVEAYDEENQLVFKHTMTFKPICPTPDSKGAISASANAVRRAVEQLKQMSL